MTQILSSLALTLLLASPAIQTGPAVELLRRSDVGMFTPGAFRSRLVLRRPPSKEKHEVELYRSGNNRTLIRFLDPKDRGKFLLRLGDQLWFLAPGAKKPVRIGPSYRLYGGITVDEVLGVRLSEEYDVQRVTEGSDQDGPLAVLELRAKSDKVMFPKVRYVVRTRTERPVSVLYQLRSGKAATSVEFLEWNDDSRPYASRILVKDLLRKAAQTEVEVLELEERAIPDALFDLNDSSARAALAAARP